MITVLLMCISPCFVFLGTVLVEKLIYKIRDFIYEWQDFKEYEQERDYWLDDYRPTDYFRERGV